MTIYSFFTFSFESLIAKERSLILSLDAFCPSIPNLMVLIYCLILDLLFFIIILWLSILYQLTFSVLKFHKITIVNIIIVLR